jgi:hypothetical protein
MPRCCLAVIFHIMLDPSATCSLALSA